MIWLSTLAEECANYGLNFFLKKLREQVVDRGLEQQFASDDKREFYARARAIHIWLGRKNYQAHRLKQLNEGSFDFWVYRTYDCSEHPLLEGLTVSSDHLFWQSHYPANSWWCRCCVYGARSDAGARRVGGAPEKPLPDGWQHTDQRTGIAPGFSGQVRPDVTDCMLAIEKGIHHLG